MAGAAIGMPTTRKAFRAHRQLTRSAAQNVSDLLAGYGELWSKLLCIASWRSAGEAKARFMDRCPAKSVSRRIGPLGPGIKWASLVQSSGSLCRGINGHLRH